MTGRLGVLLVLNRRVPTLPRRAYRSEDHGAATAHEGGGLDRNPSRWPDLAIWIIRRRALTNSIAHNPLVDGLLRQPPPWTLAEATSVWFASHLPAQEEERSMTARRPARSRGHRRQRRGFGIDVGGSGIKGGIVDLDTGQLIGERFKLLTPQPATPSAVAKTIAEVVNAVRVDRPAGRDLSRRRHRTASCAPPPTWTRRWIGTNARDIISAELDGQDVTVLNDADAAGLAEERFGAGKDNTGLIVLLTFGTGIGSAVIHNGDADAQHRVRSPRGRRQGGRASSGVLGEGEQGLELQRWTKEVTKVLVAIENAMWPDLFIAGGGISRKADKWVPLLKNRTPVVAAALLNTAGHRRRGHGRHVDVDSTGNATPLEIWPLSAVGPHCRYNGQRRPPDR